MSGSDPEVAPMEQELKPLSRSDRIKALTDLDPNVVPKRLSQRGRTQSFIVSVKKMHSGLMQRPAIVAPIESDRNGE
jgi:hypothetical protein